MINYALDNIVALINRKEPLPTGFSKAQQLVVDLTLNRGIYTITIEELFRQMRLRLESADLNGEESYLNSEVLLKLLTILDRVGISMVPPQVPSTLSIYNSVYLLKKPDLSLDQDVALIMQLAQTQNRVASLTNSQILSLQAAQAKLRNYNILVRVFECMGAAQTAPLDANQRTVLNGIMTDMLLPHDGVRYLRSLYSYACDYGSFIYHYTEPKFVSRPLSNADQSEVIDIVARTISPSHLRIKVPYDFPWKSLLENRYSVYCPRMFDLGSTDSSIKIPVNERPLSSLTLTQKRNRLKKQLSFVLAALQKTPLSAKGKSASHGRQESANTAEADAVAEAANTKGTSEIAGIDLREFNKEVYEDLLHARPGFSADFIHRVGELTAFDDPSFVHDLEHLQKQLLLDKGVRLSLPNFQQSILQLYLPPQREGALQDNERAATAESDSLKQHPQAQEPQQYKAKATEGSEDTDEEDNEHEDSPDASGIDELGYIDPTVFVPENRLRGTKNTRGGHWLSPSLMGAHPFHVLVFTWERVNHLYHSYLLWAENAQTLRPNVNSDYNGNLLQFVRFPPKQIGRLDRINCFEYILRKMFAPAQHSSALDNAGHGDEAAYLRLFEIELCNNFILLNGSPIPLLFYHSLYYFDKYLENPSTHFGNELFYLSVLEKEPYALNIYLSRICYKYGPRLIDIPEEFFTLIALNVLIFPQQILDKSYLNLLKFLFKRNLRGSNLYKVVLLRLLAHRLYCLVHEREELQHLRLELQPISQGWISSSDASQGAKGGAQALSYYWSTDEDIIEQVYEATCRLLPQGIGADADGAIFVRRYVREFCAHPVLFYQKLAPELLTALPEKNNITARDASVNAATDSSAPQEATAVSELDDRFGENLPRFRPAGMMQAGAGAGAIAGAGAGASYFLRRAQEDADSGLKSPLMGTGGAYAKVSFTQSSSSQGIGAHSLKGQLQEATLGIKRLNANAKAELLAKNKSKAQDKDKAASALGDLLHTLKQQRTQVDENPSLMAILIEEARKNQLTASSWAELSQGSGREVQKEGAILGAPAGAATAVDAGTGAAAQSQSPRGLLDNLLGTALIAALEALGGLRFLRQKVADPLSSTRGTDTVVSSVEAKRQCLSAFYINSLERSFNKNSPFADELLAPLYGTYVVPVLKRLLYKDSRYLYTFSQVLPLDQVCTELQAKIEYDFIRDYNLDGVSDNLCIINSFIYGPQDERYESLRNFVLRSDDAYHLGFTSGIKVEQMFELSLLLKRNLHVQIVPLFYPNASEDSFSRLRPRVSHIRVLEIPEYFLHVPQDEYDNVLDSLYCAYVILEILHALLPVGDQSGLITLLVQEISALHNLQRHEDCVRFAYEYLECAAQIIALEGPLKAEQLLDEKLKLDVALMGNRGTKRLKFFLTMAFSFEFQHSFVTEMVSDYYNRLLVRLHCIDEKAESAGSELSSLYGHFGTAPTRVSRLELDMNKIKAKLQESEQVQRVITELREQEQNLERQQQEQHQSAHRAAASASKREGTAKASSAESSTPDTATTATTTTTATSQGAKATSSKGKSAKTKSKDNVSAVSVISSVDASQVGSSEMKFIAGALQGAEAMAKREALHAQSQQGAIAEAQARAQNTQAHSTDEQGQVVSVSTHPINSKLSATARKVIEAIAVQGTDAMVYREFNGLCVSHGMLSGNYCIELLNDYSYEVYDEPVLELDGEGDGAIVYITTDILQDMQQHILNLKKG